MVGFDVTDFTEAEVGNLILEVSAMSEAESGEHGHPSATITAALVDGRPLRAGEHGPRRVHAMPLDRVAGACEIAAELWEPPASQVLVHLNFEVPADAGERATPEAIAEVVLYAMRSQPVPPWLRNPSVTLAEDVGA